MSYSNFYKYVCLVFLIAMPSAVLPVPPPGKSVIAVLSLKAANGVTKDEADLLTDRLGIELFNTGKFAVMERQQMETILKEQGFQQSGSCSDDGCVVQIGQLLGVQYLVTGSLGKLGNLYIINIRVIDVATGKIFKVVSRDIKGDLEDVVVELGGVAMSLAGLEGTAVRRPVDSGDEPKKEEPRPVEQPKTYAAGSVKCDKKMYYEAVVFTKEKLNLALTPEEFNSISEYANDEILDGLNECFDDICELATAAQIAAMPACNAVVVRMVMNKYTTVPEVRSQFKGTGDITLLFYEGIRSTTPSFKIEIIKEGDRDPGVQDPFTNVFDALGEEIAENLDGQDWIRKLQRKIR